MLVWVVKGQTTWFMVQQESWLVAAFRDEEQANAHARECEETAQRMWATTGLIPGRTPHYIRDAETPGGAKAWSDRAMEFQTNFQAPDCDPQMKFHLGHWPIYEVVGPIPLKDAKD